jgi:DNA polymerase (family 10)
MTNREVAALLRHYADLLEIQGGNPFRIQAYRRAADVVDHLPVPVAMLAEEQRLTAVPGIGSGIAAAIVEILETGRLSALEALQGELPNTLLTLLDLPGIGPKTVGRLYRELGIATLADLEEAALAGRIRQLKGLGSRVEQRILEGIRFLRGVSRRFLLGDLLPLAERLAEQLAEHLAVPVAVAGSIRRMRETVGNINLVAAVGNQAALVEALGRLPEIAEVQEPTPAFVPAASTIGAEVQVVAAAPERFGTELLRWTGSWQHVEALSELAGGTLPPAATEEACYQALGLPWIPPELREARGELEAARDGRLPRLVSLQDIQGDLHTHTTWSDGRGSILEMAMAARDRGYRYLAVSDHSAGLGVARGLDADRLWEQWREIEAVQAQVPEIRILRACEVEVRRDGSLDLPDKVLAELDLVVASLHTGLRLSKEEQTERIVRVIRHPHVDIIAHPTGRLIDRRPGADYDWGRVFAAAREAGKALEINCGPERLDLNDELARQALEAGVLLAINSDAHAPDDFTWMRYGIGIARRAWARPDQVLNTLPLDALLAWLER